MAAQTLPSEQGFVRSHEGAGAAKRVISDEAIAGVHAKLRATFQSGKTRPLEWRKAQLESLRRLLTENADAICEVLRADLGRPRMEALLGDSAPVVQEIDFMLQNLAKWMAPEAVWTPVLQQRGRSMIVREPKGVVLNLAPWNFPVHISLVVLAQAVAAGNCVALKPSELTPRTEELLGQLLPRYLDPDAVAVITGGVPEASALLRLRWDHIFFTGNGAIGRIVMEAAAKFLTPVTLELGGKTPTVVLPGANIPIAARRILSGKFFNAGQICIAPDYALVHRDMEQALVAEMKSVIAAWYGNDALSSDSYGRVVNDGHWARLKGLIDSSGGEVLLCGKPQAETKFMPPTLILKPRPDSPIMREEIFGPLLPILTLDSVDAIVQRINADEKPLALYIFGPEAAAEEIIRRTSSGGVCVNDTLMHFASSHLPFGGVGGSGLGRYHGKFGFDEMSHLRSVMYRKVWPDVAQRYPPYTEANLRVFQWLMVGPLLPPGVKRALAGAGAVAAGAAALALRSRL